jgi:predicted permease
MLRKPFGREGREADIERELRSHLEAETEEQLEAGVPADEAPYAARRAFGNVASITEDTRAVWKSSTLESLTQDVAYALRALRRNPGFTAVAVLSLALGIGANTAIFGIVDGLLLRQLPVEEPERLFEVGMGSGDASGKMQRGMSGSGSFSNPIWEELRDALPPTLQGAFAWHTTRLNLSTSGEIDYANAILVSGGYFTTLGVPARIGRTLTAADDRRGGGAAGAVAVISYGFWQKHYAGDPGAVGRTLSLEGHPFTIVGVTPKSFYGTDVGRSYEVALPLSSADAVLRGPSLLDRQGFGWLAILCRLAPGVTRDQARASLRALSHAAAPGERATSLRDGLAAAIELQPGASGRSPLRERYREALLLLAGATGLVLLIACANVANLLLARGAARSRELAVRVAIGAGRLRLVRQLLTESALLAGIGATLGALLSFWASRALQSFLSTTRDPVALDSHADLRMLGFTAAVTVLTALAFGLLPALRASDVAPDAALEHGGRASNGAPPRLRLGRALVVAQVALSLVLLTGAGLFLRTLHNLATLDTGFVHENVLLLNVDARKSAPAAAERAQLYRRLLESLRAIPGVRQASQAMITPISGFGWTNRADVPGYTPRTWQDGTSFYNRVSDGFFETLQTPLLAGRDFNDFDSARSAPVAIVNEALAARFTGDPIGQSFSEGRTSFEVIGVVKASKYRSLRAPAPPIAYVPWSQEAAPGASTNFQIRATGPAGALIPAVRAAVLAADPSLVTELRPFRALVNEALVQERLIAALLGFFAVLALLLAAIGLHGLIAYGVARRRREIGIRIALGADRPSVLWLVLRDVMALTTLGTLLGLLASSLLTRSVESMLYGLSPVDPLTLTSAAALLIAIGALAGWLPARRAAALQPMETLRQE